MSYDLHLFSPRSGEDLHSAAEASYANETESDEVNPGPMDPAAESRKRTIADALKAADTTLEAFAFDYDVIARETGVTVDQARERWRHIELNGPEDGPGIQIMINDNTASLTVPYWHTGTKARQVWDQIWRYLRVLEGSGGFRTYDPQLERILELGRVSDVEDVLNAYARGVAVVRNHAAELRAAAQKPWWKFWA